jgi:hypothetical protein
MPTYSDIQDDIKKHDDRTVKTCWIAHVKELNGLRPKVAHNRLSSRKRAHPCPPRVRPIIEASMRRLRMI